MKRFFLCLSVTASFHSLAWGQGAPGLIQKEASKAYDQCLRRFNPVKDMPKFIKKLIISNLVNTYEAPLLNYVQCRAVRERNAAYCQSLLKGLPATFQSPCVSTFKELVLWRDLSRGYTSDRLDALDYAQCETFKGPSQMGVRPKEFCRILADNFPSRNPGICDEFQPYISPGNWKRFEIECRQFFLEPYSPSRRTGPPGPDNGLGKFVLSHLWAKTKPKCSEDPFVDPSLQGACLGIFEPGSCEQTLNTIKTAYCKMTSPGLIFP